MYQIGEQEMNVTISDIYNAADSSTIAAAELDRRIEIIQQNALSKRLSSRDYGYYLDNCGDGKWYCDHCLQRHDCGKRITTGPDFIHDEDYWDD